jgi:hypothetical protein
MLAEARPGAWRVAGGGQTILRLAPGVDRRAASSDPPRATRSRSGPAGRQVVGWSARATRAAGVDLAPDAAQALVDLVGEDLSRLAAEIGRRPSTPRAIAVSGRVASPRGRDPHPAVLGAHPALEEARRTDAIRVASSSWRRGRAADPPRLDHGILRDLWRVLPGAVAGDLRGGASLQQRRPDFAVERLTARARAVGFEAVPPPGGASR